MDALESLVHSKTGELLAPDYTQYAGGVMKNMEPGTTMYAPIAVDVGAKHTGVYRAIYLYVVQTT